MYRQAMRKEVNAIIYKDGKLTKESVPMVAIIGKEETASNPLYEVVTDGKVKKVLEETVPAYKGVIYCGDAMFKEFALKSENRCIGGVNMSAGGNWVVTGDYCNLDTLEVMENVTMTVNDDQLALFENITSKKYKNGAWYSMTPAQFFQHGLWFDSVEEMNDFLK